MIIQFHRFINYLRLSYSLRSVRFGSLISFYNLRFIFHFDQHSEGAFTFGQAIDYASNNEAVLIYYIPMLSIEIV